MTAATPGTASSRRGGSLSAAVAGCALVGLAVAAATGLWRETALAGGLLATLAGLVGRAGRGRPRLAGLGDLLALAVACYALAALALGVLDGLHQLRLPQLASPIVANPIEGREAVKGWLLAHGGDIYPVGGAYPRLVTLYPPLYYLVVAGFSFLAGPGLWCGRLAALAGLGLLCAVLFGLGRRQAGAIAGGLAALGFLVLPEAGHGFLCKPDALAVGLLLGGALALPSGRAETAGRARLVLAAALFAGASLSKQQTWPLVAAALGWSFFVLSRREFLFFALAQVLALGLGWGAALAFFGPGLVEQVVVFPQKMTALGADNSLAAALARLSRFAAEHAWLLCAYAAWLASCLRRRRLPLADTLLLAYLPFLTRTLMWTGADTNHFLLVAAVAALGAAAGARRWLSLGAPLPRLAGALALASLLPSLVTLNLPGPADLRPTPAALETVAKARAALAAASGPVLMDAEGAYLFAGGSDWPRLRLYDAYETDVLDHLGLAPILDSVMAGDIRSRGAVRFVDSQVFISRKLLDLLDVYYEPAEKAGRYAFYRPRAAAAIVAMPAADRVARRDGPLEAVAAEAQHVGQWGRYIQSDAADAPLVLDYEAASDAPLGTASVAFCPRFTAPGQRLTATARTLDGRELGRLELGHGGIPETGEGCEKPARLDFTPPGQTFRVSFVLTPGAQLWLDPAHPLVVSAEAAAPAP
ncbi:hypothetical protein [Solidesulfovibrio sp.]|uniref:hypothetical protein n=1 Tax=Solidesulfovibrio sp. TaxID=2910990 RepID=UPI00261989FF|nr:hypothetical protein [Solidesulfovibrio sp.]